MYSVGVYDHHERRRDSGTRKGIYWLERPHFPLFFGNRPDNNPRAQFPTFQLTPFMKLFEPLMHWPPLHRNRICDPPSSHRWKLGLTNLLEISSLVIRISVLSNLFATGLL